jgi:quercetin dioxygenase-like cupin family protein
MPAPDHMQPINPDLIDTLVKSGDSGWIPNDAEGKAFMKALFVGEESGQWAALFRWNKGFVAGPHKHLSAAHTYVLKGKLQVRDGILEAGDYLYERNGMIHESTTALEDSEYLFICDGPLIFYDDSGVQGYFGWEELARMKAALGDSNAA